jgi:hypothetical protein
VLTLPAPPTDVAVPDVVLPVVVGEPVVVPPAPVFVAGPPAVAPVALALVVPLESEPSSEEHAAMTARNAKE